VKPARRDLTCTQGDDFSHTFEFREGGEPTDIADWTFQAQVRFDAGDPIVATFTFDDVDAADGRTHMELAKAITAVMTTERPYWYDIERTVDGKTRTIIEGTFTVTSQITVAD